MTKKFTTINAANTAHHDKGRVAHRLLDPALGFPLQLQYPGNPLEGLIQLAGILAHMNHGHRQLGEYPAVGLHGGGQGITPFQTIGQIVEHQASSCDRVVSASPRMDRIIGMPALDRAYICRVKMISSSRVILRRNSGI